MSTTNYEFAFAVRPDEPTLDAGAKAFARECALADAYALLQIAFQFPSKSLAEGVGSGSFMADVLEVAKELSWMDAGSSELETLASSLSLRFASDDAVDSSGTDDRAEGAARLHPFLRSVRIEFTRLFNQPAFPLISPYEGVFLDQEGVRSGRPSRHAQLFVNPAALDASRQYHRAGLDRIEGTNVPDDGITKELGFMSYLHERKAGLTIRGEGFVDEFGVSASDIDAWISEFSSIHAGKWFDAFFTRCEEETSHEFYRFAAAFGKMLVAEEILS